ncbi:MAG: hypothetical protein J2P30_00105 [Actinobacteria bacterium]|nr:hypothetical protein [Actinomycetota bacterium]
MAASLLDRIPIDEIGAEARQIRAGRALLTVLAAVLFGIGWLAAKTVTGSWLAVTWSVAAVKVGWREGRRGAVIRGAA